MDTVFDKCLKTLDETSDALRSCASYLINENRINDAQKILGYLSDFLKLRESCIDFVGLQLRDESVDSRLERIGQSPAGDGSGKLSPIVQEEAPYYFLRDGLLVKIGTASSIPSGYYKKTVPSENLHLLLDILVSFLQDESNHQFTIGEFLQYASKWTIDKGVEKPKDYHFHIVIGALNKAGILEKGNKRSTYKPVTNHVNSKMFEEGLMHLEEKEELYAMAK